MLDKLNNGIFEIKSPDDDPDTGPLSYHLIHYRIRNIKRANDPFPLRLCWKGAKFDQSLVSKTDIICNVRSSGSLINGEAVVRGSIQFGLVGHYCHFSEIFPSNSETAISLRAVWAGLSLVQKFENAWAPGSLRLWLVIDSEHTLNLLWGSATTQQPITGNMIDLINWTNRRFAVFPTKTAMADENIVQTLDTWHHIDTAAWAISENGIHWETKDERGVLKNVIDKTIRPERQSFNSMAAKKPTGNHASASPIQNPHDIECSLEEKQSPDPALITGIWNCPVNNCKNNNNNGKGYKDLQTHLERSHGDVLRSTEGEALNAVTQVLEKMSRAICMRCRKIRARINEDGLCSTCFKLSLNEAHRGEISVDIGEDEQEALLTRIVDANKFRMVTLRSVPKPLHQWWSKAVTKTLTQWLQAKTTKDTLKAIERWTKLKSTLVRPLRGGNMRRRKGWPLKKWRKNLERWVNGEWEAVWNESSELELQRQMKRRRTSPRKKEPRPSNQTENPEETMKTWMRVKRLVNDGEFSKAARDINEAGVAEPTPKVVDELKSKYPKRRDKVEWPTDVEISNLLQEANALDNRASGDLTIPRNLPVQLKPAQMQNGKPCGVQNGKKQPFGDQGTLGIKPLANEFIGKTFVVAQDIESAVKKMKKSVGGGPQQITPWMIKQAVEGSENGSCSLVIAKLSNRMANGDFGRVSGRAFGMMRSIALWKTKEKSSVRPIGIGDALKRVIVKAHSNLVKPIVDELVDKLQLGVMKGGYETGVHVMRALAKRCKVDLEVILIMDFKNAFNACNRSLLIKLAATFVPEIAHLAYWLYAEETELFISNGETLISSEGVHQGCGLANLLFALLMQYIMRRIPLEGVSAKGSYWDDAYVKSTPSGAVRTVLAIKQLKEKTNLEGNLPKFHLHAPNEHVALECKKLFAKAGIKTVEVHIKKPSADVSAKGIQLHSDMNITFLRTPIGSEDFVQSKLQEKLADLTTKVNEIARMPFKMEAFSLMKACLSKCKIVHLMRSMPPNEIRNFLTGYDNVLRRAFEKLINKKLEDKWWGVARMNSKYGGMGLKCGLKTTAAQHLTSLVMSFDDILKFDPS